MVDQFSGWSEAFAVSNKDVETVAQLLFEEIIARHGCPRSITSDNDKEFCNMLAENLTKNLNIRQTRTSPYITVSNGMEKCMEKILKYLAKTVHIFRRNAMMIVPCMTVPQKSNKC